MNIKEQLISAESMLTKQEIETPRLEAEILLAHTLKVGRLYLYVNSEQELTQEQIEIYNELINKRMNHEPTAYIIGHREFMARPETEVLVETVIDQLNDITNIVRLADIGTGSGAIALSLAKNLPGASVEAVDISEKALTIAKLNASKYNLIGRIAFHLGDLLSPLSDKKFNAIVSNPPYIPSKVIDTLQAEVRDYEPKTALNGGIDGLDFYRRLIEEAPKLLTDDGFLAVEIGFDQAEAVKHLAKDYFQKVEVVKDLSQNDRVIIARI